jgi:hypothetical protein
LSTYTGEDRNKIEKPKRYEKLVVVSVISCSPDTPRFDASTPPQTFLKYFSICGATHTLCAPIQVKTEIKLKNQNDMDKSQFTLLSIRFKSKIKNLLLSVVIRGYLRLSTVIRGLNSPSVLATSPEDFRGSTTQRFTPKAS